MTEIIDLTGLVIRAQEGDALVREELLARYRPFVTVVTAKYCRRSLDWHNDDELSIGLLAFNEAIDTYKVKAGASFLTYARMVINHRLLDHFRKEKRSVTMSPLVEEDGWDTGLLKKAWDHYQEEILIRERAEELSIYQGVLAQYGLSLAELSRICPKHRTTRQHLLKAARQLVEEQQLAAQFQKQGRLPLQELSQLTGLNRKVLERGRKYIVAVAVILLHKDLTHLRAYLQVPDLAGGEGK